MMQLSLFDPTGAPAFSVKKDPAIERARGHGWYPHNQPAEQSVVPVVALATGAKRTARAKGKRLSSADGTLASRVEKMLREQKSAYVSVDEAKKALFAASRLKSFHFVAYNRDGDNWLILCGEPRPAARADMEQWQTVFGEGFTSVFAIDRADGIHFKTLEGVEYKLSDLL